MKEVLASLEVAAQLNTMKVVLHPGLIGGVGALVMDQSKKHALDSLELIVGRANDLGVDLCLENMFSGRNSLVDPDDFVAVFRGFPTLKMTVDTGHAHIRSGSRERALEFIERFADRIFHIHASDNFGKGDDHLPVGVGTLNFREIVNAFKGIDYEGTVTPEVFSRDRDYLKTSKEKLAAMFDER